MPQTRLLAHSLEESSKANVKCTYVGKADEQRDRPGPPQRTAKDIVIAVEPYFEILSLVSSHLDPTAHPRLEPGFA
ncbi:hypothetical protein [Desulfosporosinus shakirovi]|uniref:hypothetical protein n=1 Tax=Desulfosporosinus shakirovi TaxID=2885154 RepID=UPI001E2AE058|nr:hypothetical protein [Desulfosporosinus sp. SRJS8]MCB8814580.1 hypothetical protein [Desulfosporosinus sp. SRJS8]